MLPGDAPPHRPAVQAPVRMPVSRSRSFVVPERFIAVPKADRPRLLVVDDHPDTLKLFETYLSFAGFDVTVANGAAQALSHAASVQVDAVATDLARPGMDGFELIRRLRSAVRDHPVPIVAITGQALDPARVLPAQLGCCRLLLKPCDLGELAHLLHFLVEHCAQDCSTCPHRIPPPADAPAEPTGRALQDC